MPWFILKFSEHEFRTNFTTHRKSLNQDKTKARNTEDHPLYEGRQIVVGKIGLFGGI